MTPPSQPAASYARRLSDKIMEALERAIELGRRDIAERLRLIYQATVEDDAKKADERRGSDRRL